VQVDPASDWSTARARHMENADGSDGGKPGFLFLLVELQRGRAHIVFFTNFLKSVHDGRG
jgi:hypothetical protein